MCAGALPLLVLAAQGHAAHRHRDRPGDESMTLLHGRKVYLKEGFTHECIHDMIIKNSTGPGRVHVNYDQDLRDRSRRGKTKQTRQNMRIKWFWGERNGCAPARGNADMDCFCASAGAQVPTFQNSVQGCNNDQVLTAQLRQYLDDIMADAVKWLSAALLVDPVVGNLKTGTKICNGRPCNPPAAPYCGASSWMDVGIRTPLDHNTNGVPDADYLVYVSAAPTQGNTVAWALTCMSDQRDRPIAAHVNFGPTRVDPTKPKDSITYSNYVATAVHEVMHALGFSSGHWNGKPYWFEAHCTAQGQANCKPTIQVAERGQASVTKMATPEVIKKVREYSGCPTLNGAEIENEGGSGTAGSHWEKRVFGNEGMTGVKGVHEAEWSAMTLAYFYDTGHFDVDYSMVAPDYFWGKGKGCSFWTDKCNEIQPASARAPEFCFPPNPNTDVSGCDYHFMATGRCDVNQYGSCVDNAFQYFPQGCQYGGTQSSLTDMCPTMSPYSNTECTDPADGRTSQPFDNNLGQSRTKNSRCFVGNTLETSQRYTIPMAELRCFAVECAVDCQSYEIVMTTSTGGEDRLTCNAAGQPVKPAGWDTRWKNSANGGAPNVECWAPSDICGPEARAKLGNVCGGAPPSKSPSAAPALPPTASPQMSPSASPEASPTQAPETPPTKSPEASPTDAPQAGPTTAPQRSPTASPQAGPTTSPQKGPTAAPLQSPTTSPEASPTASPQQAPTASPQQAPTTSPEQAPTKSPLKPASPTESPVLPTAAPSAPPLEPSASPQAAPSSSPAPPTDSPQAAPTKSPLKAAAPTESPLVPSASPVAAPSASPQASPTMSPQAAPSQSPQAVPTKAPLTPAAPTQSPLVPSASPQAAPSASPQAAPTKSPLKPASPTESPQDPTASPQAAPTVSPQAAPTTAPQAAPTAPPQAAPTKAPLTPAAPTESPQNPTDSPQAAPTAAPQAAPTTAPQAAPTAAPQQAPTKAPLTPASPTESPAQPTAAPQAAPTRAPQASPSAAPQQSPTTSPQQAPTKGPLTPASPTESPAPPSRSPSASPRRGPTTAPQQAPTKGPLTPAAPTQSPADPSGSPGASPTMSPVKAVAPPTTAPSSAPSAWPTRTPSRGPSAFPSVPPPTQGPTLIKDECGDSPCGSGQTCLDPTYTALGNFVCICQSNISARAVGKRAACSGDECDVSPFPCGSPAQQACVDPTTHAAPDGRFQCHCQLPHVARAGTSSPWVGRPAECVSTSEPLTWRWVGFKFRAYFTTIVGREDAWVQKLLKTLRQPYAHAKTSPPLLQVTYVCPLDKDGRKPDQGTTKAERCFVPRQKSVTAFRTAEALAETSAELQELERSTRPIGVFVEVALAETGALHADVKAKILKDDLQLGVNDEGAMRSEQNPQRADPLLIIDPIDFVATGKASEDLTVLHEGGGCVKDVCSHPGGNHVDAAIAAWEEPSSRGAAKGDDITESDDSSMPLWLLILIIASAVCCCLLVALLILRRQKEKEKESPRFSKLNMGAMANVEPITKYSEMTPPPRSGSAQQMSAARPSFRNPSLGPDGSGRSIHITASPLLDASPGGFEGMQRRRGSAYAAPSYRNDLLSPRGASTGRAPRSPLTPAGRPQRRGSGRGESAFDGGPRTRSTQRVDSAEQMQRQPSGSRQGSAVPLASRGSMRKGSGSQQRSSSGVHQI
eukprot:TRINITY_DN2361_c1_g2_i1.p1 TRINITY_DN2361_c1_g2~~TRINITY_DN2361_c1_g2_i1.p1  ORF type:complete len:1708 (+),score=322.90 TRINITY_DN2361_c1_g2_i1:87-5126(+)